MKIETEEFEAKGLTIIDRGYLDVYPYDKWGDKHLPQYRLNEEFLPNIDLNEGKSHFLLILQAIRCNSTAKFTF